MQQAGSKRLPGENREDFSTVFEADRCFEKPVRCKKMKLSRE